ncbi:MAG: Rieske 2Fe-2S domain-containing protein [Kineosporiaceae bacterium]
MSTQHAPGSEVATVEAPAAPERFENPGLPAHRHRLADIDPKAAKTAERVVAALFGISMLGTIGFLVAYFAVRLEGTTGNERLERVALSNATLGFALFAALFGIGAGAIHWAKTLMPDEERVEYRHLQRGTDDDRAAAVAILKEGAAEAGLGRRPLIRNTLLGSVGLAALAPIPLLRDLGPMPGKKLSESFWKEGSKLVNDMPGGKPVKASDLTLGSVVHVMPEGIEDSEHPLEERAKAAVLLIRLDPDDLDDASKGGAYEGIVAYSKICTHMGCPVGLYEQQTHHLLCPCHQSTFDVTQNCKVIFGPAKRPLPQLAISVDSDGYLVARGDFAEAPGPSFWERG